ncbi:MAG TPA: hypothetical protein VII06_22555 [Chloroflexota bacterium]
MQSACVLCANGCALDLGVAENRMVGARGRAVARVNRGRLGPKGLNGWVARHHAGRLTHPLIRKGDQAGRADHRGRDGARHREDRGYRLTRHRVHSCWRAAGGRLAQAGAARPHLERRYSLWSHAKARPRHHRF